MNDSVGAIYQPLPHSSCGQTNRLTLPLGQAAVIASMSKTPHNSEAGQPTATNKSYLRIGQIAERSGVSAKAIANCTKPICRNPR